MASIEAIGIRREGVINRLEGLVKDVSGLLGADTSGFSLTVQERDSMLLHLKQLEAIAEQLEVMQAGIEALISQSNKQAQLLAQKDIELEQLKNPKPAQVVEPAKPAADTKKA